MATGSPFLDLPAELRDYIFEYVAHDVGIQLHSQSQGRLTSCTSVASLCRQLHDEYEDILYTSTSGITAYVRDFEFEHLITFLDELNIRLEHRHSMKFASIRLRTLHVIVTLTPTSPSPARENLDKLYQWLLRLSEQNSARYTTMFKTIYSVHKASISDETKAIAPVTLMRIIDEMYSNWFLKTLSGALKEEIRKVCDCLGDAEREINRRRSVPIPQSVGFDDTDAGMDTDAAARLG